MHGVDGLEASPLEIDRGGDSYTADTLALPAEGHPRLAAVRDAGQRRRRRSGHLGARTRRCASWPPWSWSTGPAPRRATPPVGFRWRNVVVPRLEVSSTDLRARVVDGRPLDYLLPRSVIAGIRSLGLYRDEIQDRDRHRDRTA